MYNTDIQTTLSLMGRLVFLEYSVTEEWAVRWYLNVEAYPTNDPATESALELLELVLRAKYSKRIEEQLLSEFEFRQYEEEQKAAALLEVEDVSF